MQAYRLYVILDCSRHALYVGDRKYMDGINSYCNFCDFRLLSIQLQIKGSYIREKHAKNGWGCFWHGYCAGMEELYVGF